MTVPLIQLEKHYKIKWEQGGILHENLGRGVPRAS